MSVLVLQIVLSLLALSCAPVVLWWRRDNLLAYVAAGIFVSAYLIPLAPTLALYRLDHATVARYADILAVGAVAFLVGLLLGHQIGTHSPNKVHLTFSRPMGERLLALVTTRTRWIAAGGLVVLAGAFLLMGYVPFLAADRTAAKYGVGAYRAAFQRAAIFYRFGLAVCSSILPVSLAVWYRRRRLVDLALSLLLVVVLFLSLSRELAFLGPLVFATAVAVERRFRPVLITVLVVGAFSVGALVSLVFVQQGNNTPDDVAARIAVSAPDLRDHLGFVKGFERQATPTYGRTLLAGLSFKRTEWDPATYALRTLTGISDLREFASGGLRLPAPVWGYASFGWAGAAMFSAVSGVFAGWGVTKLRRLLTPVLGAPGAVLNLTIAYVFYEATYGAVSEFYFLSSSLIVKLAVAVAIGVAVRVALVRAPAPVPRATIRMAPATALRARTPAAE